MKIPAPFFCFVFVVFTNAQSVDQKDSLLDEILRGILENLRENAKDLAISDITFKFDIKEANVTGGTTGGLIKGLDNFVIQKLTTSFLPLKLINLTLTLDYVIITGNYSLNGKADFPNFAGPFYIFGEGAFKIELHEIFFTIAADFQFQDFKLQISPNGLNGFDFYIRRSEINFESLMGGGEKGDTLNKYLSLYLPDFINDYKFVFFNSIRDTLIKQINDFLAGENTASQPDEMTEF